MAAESDVTKVSPLGADWDPRRWQPMRGAADLATEFHTPAAAGADGIIVWGSSADVTSAAKCAALGEYVNTTLGPVLLAAR